MDNYRPRSKTRALLADVEAVLEEYRDFWPLTVRQIYYRLVGAHGHPKEEPFYKYLAHHLANARRGRLIPFEAIRDDGVVTMGLEHFDDADDFIWQARAKAAAYQRNRLNRQGLHIEVWCEAAGMLPQLARVAHKYSVEVYSCSGFDSLTAKKRLSDRVCHIGKPTIILHLGDYDPSGEAIFKSVAEDVAAFVDADRAHGFVSVEFKRVALTRHQIEQFGLATDVAKESSHAKGWTGETCQLEALAPNQIAFLLDLAIVNLLDLDVLDEDAEIETQERTRLTQLLLTGPA